MVNIRQSDIAKELNISRVTVSKALRDHTDISPAMKKKTGEVARKKGYEAIKLLISEIENKGKGGLSEIWIEEELLWRNSVKRKMKR